MSPDEPFKPETGERLRSAMQSYATRREPKDAWEDIAGRADRRWWQRAASPRVWGPGLVVAAAAAVLLFFVVGGGEEQQSEELEVGDPTQEEDQQSIIAITAADKLVEIVPGGETTEILDLRALPAPVGRVAQMPDPSELARQLTVMPRDGSVVVTRPGNPGSVDCQPTNPDPSARVLSDPWNGVTLFHVHRDGTFEALTQNPRGFAPAASPDGSRIAAVEPDLCNGGFHLKVIDLETGEWSWPVEDLMAGEATPTNIVWEGDDELTVHALAEDGSRHSTQFETTSWRSSGGGFSTPGELQVVAGPAVNGSVVASSEGAEVSVLYHPVPVGGPPPEPLLFDFDMTEQGAESADVANVAANGAPGQVLLVAATDVPVTHTRPCCPTPDLYLWTGEDEPELLESGIRGAAWGPPTTAETPTTDPPKTDGSAPEADDPVPTYPPLAILHDRVTVLDGGNSAQILYLQPEDSPYIGATEVAELVVSAELTDVYLALDNPDRDPCGPELRHYRLPGDASGETYEVIAERAAYPALSPDGSKLAYVEFDGSSAEDCPQTLVVRDLGTGDERRWSEAAEPGFDVPDVLDPEISRLQWAPDNQQLAFEHAPHDPGEGYQVWVLDTSRGPEGDLSMAGLVIPELPPGSDYWSLVAWRDDGDLVRAGGCLECTGPVQVVAVNDRYAPPEAFAELPLGSRGILLGRDGELLYLLGSDDANSLAGALTLYLNRPQGDLAIAESVVGATWVG